MIKAFSQRLMPPYSGQAQVIESEQARAVTMDGNNWEFHFLNRIQNEKNNEGYSFRKKFRRIAYIDYQEVLNIASESSQHTEQIDDRILELAKFLATAASLPFSSADLYEYWLIDPEDDSPLALIFSCVEAEQMAMFPEKTEWTALPAAVMPIERTEDELQRCSPPVNYLVERMVEERAGRKPKARWFKRQEHEPDEFPPLMLKEDWSDETQLDLCQRYIQRQSSRLLMLQGLRNQDRTRLEIAAKFHALEVERFHPLYPEIADKQLMNTILVEARLRRASKEEEPSIHKRRDGIHYL